MSSLLSCQCTPLPHIQFFIHQNPPSPLQGNSQWFLPVCTHAWDCPEMNLLNIFSLLSFSWTHFSSWTQICFHSKLAASALSSTVHVSNKGIEEHWSQSPVGHHPSLASMDTELLTTSASLQPFLIHWTVHPSNALLSSLELRMPWDTTLKALQNSRQMTLVSLPLTTISVTPSQEATRLVRHICPVLAVLDHLFILHLPKKFFPWRSAPWSYQTLRWNVLSVWHFSLWNLHTWHCCGASSLKG